MKREQLAHEIRMLKKVYKRFLKLKLIPFPFFRLSKTQAFF